MVRSTDHRWSQQCRLLVRDAWDSAKGMSTQDAHENYIKELLKVSAQVLCLSLFKSVCVQDPRACW